MTIFYQCDNCNYVFAENDLHPVSNSDGETHSGCPACKSWEMYEVKECELCGNNVDESEIDCNLCPECRERTKKEAQEFCDNMSDAQLDYLAEFFDFSRTEEGVRKWQ